MRRLVFASVLVGGALAASVALAGTFATQWALQGASDVDLIEGHDKQLSFTPASTAPVVIGLIDTGIDYTNPALAPSLWRNPGEIAGNCIDDDANGYIDDVYGIRVDLQGFDNRLVTDLAAARDQACTAHKGSTQTSSCVATSSASATDLRAIEGLNLAYARASGSFARNPLLYPRTCASGFGATESQRRMLAQGDPIDYWWGHGTLMASTMASRSGVANEPASLLDLPSPTGGKLGDHVKIVTCATGFPADVDQNGTFVMPRATHAGAVECADYFLSLKERGVNLVAVNVSFGIAERFPIITGTDVAIEPDAWLHNSPALRSSFEALSAAGITLVAAAHNLFRDVDDTPAHAMYPAAFEFDNVIGVGGVNERGVWFGNRGRNTADLVAPAQRIIHHAVSPEIAMMARFEGEGDKPFDQVTFGEGTSQATAYVSSMVALLKANASTAQLTPPELRALLLSSATPLPSNLPWMLVLRPAGDTTLQAVYWAMLGMFEPSTRTIKQQQLSANSLSGRIARLDRALACQSESFTRITAPVPRMVAGVGAAFEVRAESYVCAAPAAAASLAATVTLPSGAVQSLTLQGRGDGTYVAAFMPTTSGSFTFALNAAPSDVLTVTIP